MNDEAKTQAEIARLRRELQDLESQAKQSSNPTWDREKAPFYPTYLAWSGAVLGMIGAVSSLLLNIVGSLIWEQHPLKLVQIYLTFPLGEKALSDDFDTGIALAIGCCLYILTGAVLAIPIQLVMARFYPDADIKKRLLVGTVVGLVMWAVNFYLLIAWLQPWLFDGNWIVEQIPPWIGAITHLVFAWTVAALSPWGYLKQGEFVANPTES